MSQWEKARLETVFFGYNHYFFGAFFNAEKNTRAKKSQTRGRQDRFRSSKSKVCEQKQARGHVCRLWEEDRVPAGNPHQLHKQRPNAILQRDHSASHGAAAAACVRVSRDVHV